jgi:hypothetical protein
MFWSLFGLLAVAFSQLSAPPQQLLQQTDCHLSCLMNYFRRPLPTLRYVQTSLTVIEHLSL